jgi:DNA-binding transcriptional MerR regulator
LLQICYILIAMSDASGFLDPPGRRSPGRDDHPDPGRGLYGISVAAELVGSAPQNLRLYETRGLVSPARSQGGTRRYSDDDLARLREIGRLLDDGLNLAGIAAVLALRAANRSLQAELDLTRRRASTARHPRTVR